MSYSVFITRYLLLYMVGANVFSVLLLCDQTHPGHYIWNYIYLALVWEGLVTKYHKKYREDIGIQPCIEAYIQSLVLKKTFESIFFDRRRSFEEDMVQVQIAGKVIEVTSDVVKADTPEISKNNNL